MKRHPILIPASLLALALAACGPAPDLEEGPAAPVAPAAGSPAEAVPVAGQEEGVTVRDPWLRQPPPSAGVSAGYLLIENPGAYADRLLAVETDAAERVEIHEMDEVDGLMRMREIEGGLEIPAGGEVALQPGGYHLMLMGAGEGVVAGRHVDAVLVFERAGRVGVTFEVRPPGASAAADRGQAHGH
ncbi:MAG: copper chaperone PCu(A)C [Gammaproteobacteria bacterium]|nr:copper chaperone PCu(A)C [Gammaproteobacteria bacterium]